MMLTKLINRAMMLSRRRQWSVIVLRHQPENPVTPPSIGRNRKPFISLLAADGISQTGNMLTMLAVPWFVLETTGSAARTGVTAAVGAIAAVIAGLLGGALVDRLGHKRTSIISDLASGVTAALIPFLHLTIGLAFWQLLVLVFLGTLLDIPGWSARRSLYETVARLGGIGLERTNGTAMMVNRAAGLAGPLLAGVLIATIGATNVLWIDAASFFISAGLVAFGLPARIVPRLAATTSRAGGLRGYASETLDGFRFLRGDRFLFSLILGAALGQLIAEPFYSIVLPVYANQVFGSSVDLGTMFAALAVGSIAGNLVFLAFAPRLPRRTTILVGFTIRALAFWVLVPLPSLWIIVVVIAIEALFLEPVNPIWMTIVQERVPEEIRGRVFGSMLAFSSGAQSLGLLSYGLLLGWFGLQDTLIILAVINLSLPLTLALLPALKDKQAFIPRTKTTQAVT